MPSVDIQKTVGVPPIPTDTTNAIAISFDTSTNQVRVSDGTTSKVLSNNDGTSKTTTNIGTKSGATVSVAEYGNGMLHQTVFTLTALPLTVLDTGTGVGVKIYDFPEGDITIIGASGSVAEKTTSTLSSTWHSNVAYTWGLGTVTQAAGTTLATTECDIIPGTAGIAGVTSTTINVAAVASIGSRTIAPANHVGHTTAKSAFFNVATAAADIDADATTTWTGTITVSWMYHGDV